jgi:hypothetical protein
MQRVHTPQAPFETAPGKTAPPQGERGELYRAVTYPLALRRPHLLSGRLEGRPSTEGVLNLRALYLFHILRLLADLLDLTAGLEGEVGDAEITALGGNGIHFAMDLL